MGVKTDIVFTDTSRSVETAVEEIFGHFGPVSSLLKKSGDVYIKVNAVDSKKFCYTDPSVLAAVIKKFKQGGAKNVYVIENCTQASITRLVFAVTGIFKVCSQTGAIPVCLDETGAVPVFLEGIESFVDFSSFVVENLVRRRDENLYVSLPKLKTHSMSQVTLSVKNQFGFVHQKSRVADHNYRIHQKFADIHRVVRPDFVIIDGIIATNHGHYIAEKNAAECVVETKVLIGGADPLATDVAASKFLGFDLADVPHLALAAETGLGQGDFSKLNIIGEDLFNERRQQFPHELLYRFPPGLAILRGAERCCKEGCRRNTETLVEPLYCDHNGSGNFTILMGKGIDPDEVAKINGPVHVAGSCAIGEHGLDLSRRLGKKNVTFSHGCNNLAETAAGISRHMGVNLIGLAGTDPLTGLALLVSARLRGSKAVVPPLF